MDQPTQPQEQVPPEPDPPGETPPPSERGYVVLVEALPMEGERARWDTVLRGEFPSRAAAEEAGRQQVEDEEESEQDRRIVAVPYSYFKPRTARYRSEPRLEWDGS